MSSPLVRVRNVALVFVIVVALAFSVVTVTVTAPAGAAESAPAQHNKKRTCDASGDMKLTNDCVLHRSVNAAIDNSVRPGEKFMVQVGVDHSLRGWTLRTHVQMRRTGAENAKWKSRATKVWHVTRFDTRVRVKAPRNADMFALRTKTTVVHQSRQFTPGQVGATTLDSALWSATSTMGVGANCSNTDQDEDIVEYFNEMNFDDEFSISVQDKGTAYTAMLICPADEPWIPSEFGINLVTEDGVTEVACEGIITLPKSQLSAERIDYCVGTIDISCGFNMIVFNSSSNTVYSRTSLQVTLTPGINASLTPELMDATMPICNNVIAECVESGTCSLSTSKAGAIQLCADATSCLTPNPGVPPVNYGYSYDEQVYFETALHDTVT